MVPSEVVRAAGAGRRQEEELGEWLRDEFFKQHCAAVREPAVHLAHLGRSARGVLRARQLPPARPQDAGEADLHLSRPGLGRSASDQRCETTSRARKARLAAALGLQRKLEAILAGEQPYDIYVRWKELREQPIGWEPDLNDGVRLNIRPFVEAGVLRSPVQHPLEEGSRQEPGRFRAAQ